VGVHELHFEWVTPWTTPPIGSNVARDHGHALGSGSVNGVTDCLGETMVGTLEQHRQTLVVG